LLFLLYSFIMKIFRGATHATKLQQKWVLLSPPLCPRDCREELQCHQSSMWLGGVYFTLQGLQGKVQ
jgi:hypothetical protein